MVATVNASTSAGVVITPDNSGVLAFQSSSATALTIDASQNSTFVGTASATKLIPTGSSATGNGLYLPAANSLGLSTNGSARVQIYSDGVTKIITTGTTAPTYSFTNYGEGLLFSNGDNSGSRYTDIVSIANTPAGATSNMRFWTNEGSGAGTATEKMRIDTGGNLLIGQSTTSTPGASGDNTEGVAIKKLGNLHVSISGSSSSFNRKTDDGTIMAFNQDATTEGYIGVSGTTVSYNGAHLSRSAQMIGTKDTSLLKGTVMSNLNDMNEYIDSDDNIVI
jgi:hypothetical protein